MRQAFGAVCHKTVAWFWYQAHMLEPITARLFAAEPDTTLYHYTSFSGLLGIVGGTTLRASDVRYMNDSAELSHTLQLMRHHVTQRIIEGTDKPALLNQLLEWLSHQVVNGPLLFGASFRANGNLLSQWRGYSIHGKGVSLGFSPAHIGACATRQRFRVVRCLYDSRQQGELIHELLDVVESMADTQGENLDPSQRHPSHSWYDLIERLEEDLLRIAAVLKHPTFEEEQEWRLMSPVINDCETHPIDFREGSSMLVPYYAFNLRCVETGALKLEHVYLGPTANIELSMNSLDLYLRAQNAQPRGGISYCQIPYRQK